MHSVSLSSDQGDGDDHDEQHVQTYPLDTDIDKDSLAESFEDVTVPASYREHAPISYSQRRVPPPPSARDSPIFTPGCHI